MPTVGISGSRGIHLAGIGPCEKLGGQLSTRIGLAADLQLAGAMPVARYVEFLTPSPYIDELITEPFRPDADGLLPILDRPGLGIELNREALKRLSC